jgi:hypothetical protein
LTGGRDLTAGGFGVAKNKDVFSFDDDFEDENPSSESEQIAKEFRQNANSLVTHHLTNYFKDKMLHTGGSIPSQFLNSQKRISMVLNYNICTGVDHAHERLEFSEGRINDDENSELIVTVLHEIAKNGVPKEFAGGMLCLHLELVEGIDF